jgi:hypothetical protein
MQVASPDVIWLLSHTRVISSELSKPAGAAAAQPVHVGASSPPSSQDSIRHPVDRPRTGRRVPARRRTAGDKRHDVDPTPHPRRQRPWRTPDETHLAGTGEGRQNRSRLCRSNPASHVRTVGAPRRGPAGKGPLGPGPHLAVVETRRTRHCRNRHHAK